ncbi:hypothetical protein Nizo2802_1730 [Lactiplantibacillus plantarum]|nr:hypothetical protein Nizo2802_1730 [Lactiplantibacillus plantarum]
MLNLAVLDSTQCHNVPFGVVNVCSVQAGSDNVYMMDISTVTADHANSVAATLKQVILLLAWQ